jgi:hypothetical protein
LWLLCGGLTLAEVDEATRRDKLARVDAPAVAALNARVRRWRVEGRSVPWFDPDGGGVHARVLLLLESSGPATTALADRGISSEDNPDPTARALRAARQASSLAASDCLRWNVVPWALTTADGWRNPRASDLAEAGPALAEVLAMLPGLRVVVPLGAAALTGWMRHLTLQTPAGPVVTLAVPHPSQRNTRSRAESNQRLRRSLQTAAAWLPELTR